MVSREMLQLGRVRSAIRELFEFGRKRAAVVGGENVYDFSLGNPSVPPPKRLTDEMVREILVDCLGHQESNEKYIPLAAGWDRDKMADAMYALCCLILNNAALIEPKHAETISKVSDALGDCCGGDSSTYNACEAFGNVLKGLAVRVIPFPMPDLDEGEARDYEA